LAGIDKRLLVLDAFENGLPVTRHDRLRTGNEYDFSRDVITQLFDQAVKLGVLDRMDVFRGRFCDTFRSINERRLRFSFVHIDANYFEGTRDACAFSLPRMARSGLIVFDDYNGVCDLGARLAIDQCLAGSGLRPIRLAGCSATVNAPSVAVSEASDPASGTIRSEAPCPSLG
jgi:hypothetical protein